MSISFDIFLEISFDVFLEIIVIGGRKKSPVQNFLSLFATKVAQKGD